MGDNHSLLEKIKDSFGAQLNNVLIACDGMVTVELAAHQLHAVCKTLCDDPVFYFEQLIDLSGIDYSQYGVSEWRTEETSTSGFSRAVEPAAETTSLWDKPRFAVIYHLLSVSNNQRLRLKVFVNGEPPLIPSVVNFWSSANWYEREAFDLFGIVFDGHPDLRRILTDYGFVGHPFRKDFPLIGQVELRYDATQKKCVYEPVSIQPRVLVPKVVRHDNRYLDDESSQSSGE